MGKEERARAQPWPQCMAKESQHTRPAISRPSSLGQEMWSLLVLGLSLGTARGAGTTEPPPTNPVRYLGKGPGCHRSQTLIQGASLSRGLRPPGGPGALLRLRPPLGLAP